MEKGDSQPERENEPEWDDFFKRREGESHEDLVARVSARNRVKNEESARRMRERWPNGLQPGEDFAVRPALRIRDDAPSIAVNEDTSAGEAIKQAADAPAESLVLRGETGEAKAVVLTPERYAELAGYEVHANNGEHLVANEQGIVPGERVLEGLMIEQVDPDAKWAIGAQVWPRRPHLGND